MGQELRAGAGRGQSDILPPIVVEGLMVVLRVKLALIMPVEHFLDRKSVFQDANVVFGEGVGHVQPVSAVVHTGVEILVGVETEALILDGAENAGELARQVNRFRHYAYYTGAE